MAEYRLRGAHRAEDGTIGETLLDEPLTAANRQGAIKAANARDWSADHEAVNALWLVDESGAVLWSLRMVGARERPDDPVAEP